MIPKEAADNISAKNALKKFFTTKNFSWGGGEIKFPKKNTPPYGFTPKECMDIIYSDCHSSMVYIIIETFHEKGNYLNNLRPLRFDIGLENSQSHFHLYHQRKRIRVNGNLHDFLPGMFRTTPYKII